MRTPKPWRTKLRGELVWCVSTRENGKRRRHYFHTQTAASAFANRAKVEQQEYGERFLSLNAVERTALLQAHEKATALGVTIDQALEYWMANNQSIDAVSIGDAIPALLESKREANLRPKTIRQLGMYLRLFARGRESMPVSAFTPADIEQWFRERKETPATKQSNLGRLSSLFAFAHRRGWVRQNICTMIERVRVDARAPEILSPRQAARLVLWTRKNRPDMLAWLTLALFAGIRPEEAMQVEWRNVKLDEGTIVADFSKVRGRRRAINAMPAAIVWLRIAKDLGSRLPVPNITRRRFLHQLREVLGREEWPHDILRHSCASYWLAHTGDVGFVATQLGNSASVLLRHYQEIVTKKEAARFWGMVPRMRAVPAARKGKAKAG